MDFGAMRTVIYLHFSIISFIGFGELVSNVFSDEVMHKMQKVKENILKNYDKHIRPTNGTNATEISFEYVPWQIRELDDETATLTVVGCLNMSWFDPRLAWNESEYDGYLALPRDLLWVPDITLWNNFGMEIDPTPKVLLGLYPSGDVVWLPPVMTKTICPSVSSSPYPGDVVQCIIQFGSWIHKGWSISFAYSYHELNAMNGFVDINPRWKLKAMYPITSHYYSEDISDCCSEPHISMDINLYLERRPVPEIEAARAPCILVMLLTLAIFWLPPDSSLKLLLGGILFLVLNLLLVYLALSTKYPGAVALAVSFIQTTMYLVVATLLLQVFVVIKVGALSGPSRPPAAVLHYLKGALGRYACLCSPMAEDHLFLEPSPREEWKLLAAAIDRALFLLMAIAMVSVHHLKRP